MENSKIVTPDEWLAANGLKPFEGFWGTEENKLPDDDPRSKDENDYLLPHAIFTRLSGPLMRSLNCKMYDTDEEALEDFRNAFNQALEDGMFNV